MVQALAGPASGAAGMQYPAEQGWCKQYNGGGTSQT